jgi:hypothetical protein
MVPGTDINDTPSRLVLKLRVLYHLDSVQNKRDKTHVNDTLNTCRVIVTYDQPKLIHNAESLIRIAALHHLIDFR